MTEKSIEYRPEHKIKEIRLLRNLTRQELASMVGTSKDNLYQIETGRRNLAIKWLSKFADALGCSKAQLLGEKPIEGMREVDMKPKLSVNNEYLVNEKCMEYTIRVIDNLANDEKINRYGKGGIFVKIYGIMYDYYKSNNKSDFITNIEKQKVASDSFLKFIARTQE